MKKLKLMKGALINGVVLSSLCASGPESLSEFKAPGAPYWHRIEAVQELMKSPSFMTKDGAYKEISRICRDIAGDQSLTSVGMLVLAHIFQEVGDDVGMQAMIRGIQRGG